MINFLNGFSFANIAPAAMVTAPCPDQFCGELRNGTFIANIKRVDINYVMNGKTKSISNSLRNPVVVLLESPHKDEYDSITQTALGPCMGRSGDNFRKKFDVLIKGSSMFNKLQTLTCDIVLFNTIQYQCSLGLPLAGKANIKNKKQRDSNFIACIRNGNDFIDRLGAIRPHAIINLCTKGTRNLQQIVRNIYNQSTLNFLYVEGYHPSAWNNSRYQKIN